MSLRFRISSFCLIAFGVATLLAGCGGSSVEPARELSSFTDVVNASATAETGRFELSLEQTMPGTSKAFRLSASGAFDTAAKRASMSFDMSGFAGLLGGNGGNADDWKLAAVQDGLVIYMRFPLLTSQLPQGKPWVRLDLAELGKQQGVDLAQLQSIASSDPRKALDYLKAVAGKIVPLGRESVRGVGTTHYKASIDLSKYSQLVPDAQRDAAQGMLDTLMKQTGLSIVPADVWIDDDGLLRKAVLSLEVTPPGGDEPYGAKITIEMFDYGKGVSIAIPAAEDVVDQQQLLRP